MRIYIATTALLLGLLGTNASASQLSPTPGQDSAETRMSEYAASRPPIGYVQFCNDNPRECRSGSPMPQRLVLTPARLKQLNEVNDLVNEAIAPITDEDLYGVAEKWTYPLDRGDCEDYVLLKRRLLAERGWPLSSLLITVVRDTKGDGHAVLTVTTSAGDLVLDNQVPEIHFWRDTPYDFLKRQSKTDPNAWVSLRYDDSQSQYSVGGTPNR
ncbi:transglutaminase-like cysteine peptidase [Microbaculum marinum]|uniref:Transglutaminase-like cysteine peptidase n=1 Tax=Microbaculum marinum TaxID=1764581 RepID=A0AAW9RW63_9HYPH